MEEEGASWRSLGLLGSCGSRLSALRYKSSNFMTLFIDLVMAQFHVLLSQSLDIYEYGVLQRILIVLFEVLKCIEP